MEEYLDEKMEQSDMYPQDFAKSILDKYIKHKQRGLITKEEYEVVRDWCERVMFYGI